MRWPIMPKRSSNWNVPRNYGKSNFKKVMKIIPRIILATLSLSACIAIFSGCSRSKAATDADAGAPNIQGDKITFPANAPQLGQLTVEPAEEQNAAATDLNGRLAWDDDVTARVFPPVSGRIVEILANPGQSVAAGDVLAKIQSPDFGQAQADARKAVADLKQSDRALSRARELLAHGAAAEKDVEAAENDYAHAVSEKERALATLSLYGGSLNGSGVDGVFSLKAPVGGVVVDKSVNPGQEVRADQIGDKPLFVVSDPSRLWIQMDAAEVDLSHLQAGGDFVFTSRVFPEQTFTGRVDVISQFIDPNTRTIKVRGTVNNPQSLLKAEMFVSVTLPNEESPSVGLPSKAVFLKGEKHFVFVEEQPGKFARQEVKIGSEENGRIFVLSGVQPGQRIVTDGSILLERMLD
jgi:cobalt-zinc-cadmium efflux system membrane fusion protein